MPLTVITSGSDIKLDDLATPDDNTDLNATTGHHGLLPKLSGVGTEFLNGSGSWATPAGGGGTPTLAEVLVEGNDPDGTAIAGANGGAETPGGDVTLAGGDGDSGNDAGASLVVHGGDGGGSAGGVTVLAGDTASRYGSGILLRGGHDILQDTKVYGVGGKAGQAGGPTTITGGTGDDGNDAGASITLGGGWGDGGVGGITATGNSFVFDAAAGGKIELSSTGTIQLLPGVGDAYIQVNPDSTFSLGGDITLESGGVFVGIRAGSVDPSAGSGIADNPGSLYLRNDGAGTGELWIKTGSADTAWTKVV